jgi:hypothetical protein
MGKLTRSRLLGREGSVDCDSSAFGRLRGAACIGPAWQPLHSIAEVLLARLRNSNFWILPVAVLGIGSKRISLGTL